MLNSHKTQKKLQRQEKKKWNHNCLQLKDTQVIGNYIYIYIALSLNSAAFIASNSAAITTI